MCVSLPAIRQLLDIESIPYEITEHPAVYTIADTDALHLAHGGCVAKNLFICDDKKQHYFLFTIKKERRLDLSRMRTLLGTRRLCFASEEDLHTILGLSRGGVTPLGILNDRAHRVRVILDTAFRNGSIGIHPNTNTATLWLQATDLFTFIQQQGNPIQWLPFPESD